GARVKSDIGWVIHTKVGPGNLAPDLFGFFDAPTVRVGDVGGYYAGIDLTHIDEGYVDATLGKTLYAEHDGCDLVVSGSVRIPVTCDGGDDGDGGDGGNPSTTSIPPTTSSSTPPTTSSSTTSTTTSTTTTTTSCVTIVPVLRGRDNKCNSDS